MVSTACTTAPQSTAPIALLPTDRDAARVHTVQERLTNHLSADVARDYGDLKNIVQNFIVRQLDAARAISDEALRT